MRNVLLVGLACAMWAGCSESVSTPPDSGPRDAGGGVDAPPSPIDSGGPIDSGPPTDTGPQPDAPAPSVTLVVNELQPQGDDFAEIVNTGTLPLALDGYHVADAEGIGEPPADPTHRTTLPAGLTLAPGEHFVVAMNLEAAAMTGIVTDAAQCRGASRCVHTSYGMSAGSGDTFAVLAPSGAVVAEGMVAGAALADGGQTWSRLPDATGDFAIGASTPGAVNAAP